MTPSYLLAADPEVEILHKLDQMLSHEKTRGT